MVRADLDSICDVWCLLASGWWVDCSIKASPLGAVGLALVYLWKASSGLIQNSFSRKCLSFSLGVLSDFVIVDRLGCSLSLPSNNFERHCSYAVLPPCIIPSGGQREFLFLRILFGFLTMPLPLHQLDRSYSHLRERSLN